MANNRMLLVHRPTGIALLIAKRYFEWYPVAESADLDTFFDTVFKSENPLSDDFGLYLEDARDAPLCSDDFAYSEPIQGKVRYLALDREEDE